jgi:hypothetical protein
MLSQADEETVAIGDEHGKDANDHMSHGKDVVQEIVIDKSCESFGREEMDNRSEQRQRKGTRGERREEVRELRGGSTARGWKGCHLEAWMKDISEMAT